MARGKKGTAKVRVNMMLDGDLHERMKKINEGFGGLNVNWSQMVNQALYPVVTMFESVLKELEKGSDADLEKVKYVLKGSAFDSIGSMVKEYKETEQEVEKAKVKRKKIKG